MFNKSTIILFWLITSILFVLKANYVYASNFHKSKLVSQINSPLLPERNLLALESSTSEELRKNQELWAKQKLRNYRYSFRAGCFCPPDMTQPVIIDVRSGKNSSIRPETNRNIVNREFFQKYDSIDKLFEIIRSAIAKNAHRIDVQYHPTLGYPTQISIDYNKEIADEETFLTINKLEAQ